MSWETIANLKPVSAAAVPHDGVAVSARKLGKGRGGKALEVRYIKVVIGAGLAKKLCLVQEQVRLHLALGGGKWSGRVALAVDNTFVGFPARRDKQGRFVLTINRDSAEGLFALDFPAFTAVAEPVTDAPRGMPPMFAFRPSAAMLAGAE